MRKLLVLTLMLQASAAMALGLAPTRAELDLASVQDASIEVRIDGRIDSETLVDLSLSARDAESLPAGDGTGFTITVQPPQVVIPAGGQARVRLSAHRDGPLTVSRSYYLVVEHLGVSEAGEAGGLKQVDFLTRIHLPVHVAGSGQAALDWRIVNDGESRVLRLANSGQRYQRLSLLQTRLQSRDGTPDSPWLEGISLARRAGSDAVLPGQRLFLPLEDDEIADGQLIVEPIAELAR